MVISNKKSDNLPELDGLSLNFFCLPVTVAVLDYTNRAGGYFASVSTGVQVGLKLGPAVEIYQDERQDNKNDANDILVH